MFSICDVLKVLLILGLTNSCETLKYIPDNKLFLEKQEVLIQSTTNKKKKKIHTEKIAPYFQQKNNTKALGIPLKLYLFNLANPNAEDNFYKKLEEKPKTAKFWTKVLSKKQIDQFGKSYGNLNRWLTRNGEPPAILNKLKIQKTTENLKKY